MYATVVKLKDDELEKFFDEDSSAKAVKALSKIRFLFFPPFFFFLLLLSFICCFAYTYIASVSMFHLLGSVLTLKLLIKEFFKFFFRSDTPTQNFSLYLSKLLRGMVFEKAFAMSNFFPSSP